MRRVNVLPNIIDPFYQYGGHIEFITFKEYYGMPREELAQYLCARFGQKENSLYICREKHGTTIFFSHYNLFLGKLNEELARKARENAERVYRIVLITPPPRTSHNTP